MKKVLAMLALFCSATISAHKTDPIIVNPYANFFDEAYEQYPSIPRGLLESVAFNNTRFNHITHATGEPESCSGMPKAYGVMGLMLDGKGYFNENLKLVSKISGYSVQEILDSPEKNILAYAKALDAYLKKYDQGGPTSLTTSLILLSELPGGKELQNFAVHTQLYGYLSFMNDPKIQALYKFPDPAFDLKNLFGEENYKVLSSSRVTASANKITDNRGNTFKNGYNVIQSPDYAPALSAITACNYSFGRSQTVTAVTIHDIEGSYAGAISWFNNCSAQVSAHYCVRSSDGQITQVVLESNTAWHVGTENPYTVGIEHEGYANQTGWYTTNMYQQSALLVQDICADHGINTKRTLFQPWGNTTYYNVSGIPGSCTKVKGHMHYPNQTHTDPGPNWDWDYFYKLVNDPAPAATMYTTGTGNFFDSGGSGGNYADDERLVWTIAPPGATNVTLTFNSFDVENTWDYMYVYDGPDVWSPLIGYYTGTTNPGTLIANSGTLTVEFRSDCGTTGAGWDASWSSNGNIITPANLAITSASCPQDSVTLKWSNSGAGWYVDVTDDPTWTDFYNKAVPNLTSIGCPGGFANYTNTSLYLAFKPNTTYYWRVWDGTSHTYGNSFMTPSCIYQDTSCSGTFDDTGGPSGSYSGNEDYVSVFEPGNATSVTLNFTSFDLETDFDSMWVYNGNSTAAPLLGIYTGTVVPSPIVANSGAMTVRFKADPFVNKAGWTATWSCTQNSSGINNHNNSFALSAAPNPTGDQTSVFYYLHVESTVSLKLYDMLGKEWILLQENQNAGQHTFRFSAKEQKLSAGVYFLSVKTGSGSQVIKIVIE